MISSSTAALALSVLSAPCLAGGGVELSIGGSLEAGDVETSPGANVTVEYVVSNSGPSEAEDVVVSFYLSTDTTFDASDTFIESEDVSLDEFETEDESEQITIPSSTAPGCYFVLLFVDSNDAFAESDESDNVDATPVALDVSLAGCTADLPNLTVTNPTLSAPSVVAGEGLTVGATVVNDGHASASDVELFYLLSDDAVYDGLGVEESLSFDEADVLLVGQDEALSDPVTIPAGTPPGDYTVFFVVDAGADIAELDEGDNVLGLPLVVESAGDPWEAIGSGVAGVAGVPQLTGDGSLAGGTQAALRVTSAAPLAPTTFVIGAASVGQPAKGGVLVPSPDALVSGFSTDAEGRLTLPFSVPAGTPPGTQAFFQAWIVDAAGPGGFSATNGLSATTP